MIYVNSIYEWLSARAHRQRNFLDYIELICYEVKSFLKDVLYSAYLEFTLQGKIKEKRTLCNNNILPASDVQQ
jgi:hypothetical protein